MKVNEISAEQYQTLLGQPQYIYNSSFFLELNSYKVDEVRFLLFEEKKKKFVLGIGIKNDIISIPFSAPFGIFEKLQSHIKLEDIEDAIATLSKYAISINAKKIVFKLPPSVYDESFIAKMQYCLLRQEYKIKCTDLNYHMSIDTADIYETSIHRNAKKNLKSASKAGFSFYRCVSEQDYKDTYDVIKQNRLRKGYPLRMSFEQVMDTVRCVSHDFFLLKKSNELVASAIVFAVNEQYYQVIYWGDLAGYEQQRPMNFLAYQINNYYREKGICLLDIGPSTDCGEPNYGLSDFKESIGCSVSMKFTFEKIF